MPICPPTDPHSLSPRSTPLFLSSPLPSDRQNEPPPQTLATEELVWAKTKGHHHWWPTRLHSLSTHPSTKSPLVSSLGTEYSDDHHPAAAVKPFLAAPDVDALVRANTSLTFIAAIAHAWDITVGIPLHMRPQLLL
ncbi:hypothetical protein ZWY2020_028825 [Hordeum vulgare]|nr:hypothetical protein ZWY2020_028825 [Hordeum vulgare]